MAYGKKNHVKIDPLAYNICVLGESKCGKTTLIYHVLQKLVNDDGYLFLECGHEKGADAIEGINYVNCPEWEMDFDEYSNSVGFLDVCDDIIENKSTDYKNLRVVVIDTYDQLITMAEKEVIRTWNRDNPDKIAKSIKATYGGFSEPSKKVLELMFDKFAELESVGVKTLIIGHVKLKDVSDAVTGETYQVLTSDQQQNYFNALKKNLHFLGLCYIDREIVKVKTGKKNVVTKKEEIVGKVKSEARKIKFRDDNYAIDSGSRFADIVPEIEMSADNFIKALVDAIKAEQAKSGKSYDETKKEQDKIEAERLKEITKAEKAKREAKKVDDVVKQITDYIKANKTDLEVIKPIIEKSKELGYDNPTMIDNLDDAKIVLALIEE